MKQRKIYLRKKAGRYVFECKVKGKTVYILAISQPYDDFILKLIESSFFTREKADKIKTILMSADYKDNSSSNKSGNCSK